MAISLQPVTPYHAPLLHLWRNDEAVRDASLSTAAVPWEEHVRYVERRASRGFWWLAVEDDMLVGVIRFDKREAGWDVGVTVAPEHRGQGLGAAIIAAGTDRFLHESTAAEVRAVIKKWNAASSRAFAKVGYTPAGEEDGLCVYRYGGAWDSSAS